MEPKSGRAKARNKPSNAAQEDKTARAKTAKDKEITREIIEHAFVYRNWLTRTFDVDE